jgi:hypothetical protein
MTATLESLAIARRATRAALLLARHGETETALARAHEARALYEAAVVAASAREDADARAFAERLVDVGLPRRSAPRVARDFERVAALPASPASGARSGPSLDAALDAFLASADDVHRAVEMHVLPLAKRRVLTLRRLAAPALVGLLVVGALARSLALRPGVRVHASAVFLDDPTFAAHFAADGQVDTEWLPPDATPGLLDVTLFPRRTVHRLKITNGHNRGYMDRAVRDFTVELLSHGRVQLQRSGRFEKVDAAAPPLVLDVGEVKGIDEVRFSVVSWHGRGAALAEIAFE